MKRNSVISVAGAIGIALSSVPTQAQVLAQPDTKTLNPAAPRFMPPGYMRNNTQRIGDLVSEPLRTSYVKPSLLAWWLDPANNAAPTALTTMVGSLITPTSKPFPIPAPLPEGMARIVPIDYQNVLLLIGKPEAVAQIKETINLFDKRIQMVQLEAQIIAVDDENLAALGLKLTPKKANQPTPLELSVAPQDIQTRLKALVAAGKAVIQAEPRVTAINNIPASLKVNSDKIGTILVNDLAQTVQNESVNPTVTNTGALHVMPTINQDNTVTLLIKTNSTTSINVGAQQLPLSERNQSESISTVPDGDTIALAGIKPDFFFQAKSATASRFKNVVALITPRIVRTIHDE